MAKTDYTREDAIEFVFDDTWEEDERDSSDPQSAYSDFEVGFAAGLDPDMDCVASTEVIEPSTPPQRSRKRFRSREELRSLSPVTQGEKLVYGGRP